jgi:uncharacterized coiled-coil DUF342 family protein
MNKIRRAAIEKLNSQLDDIKTELEGLADEEQQCFDNLPESLQTGDRGTNMEEAANALSEAVGNIEAAIENLESAVIN